MVTPTRQPLFAGSLVMLLSTGAVAQTNAPRCLAAQERRADCLAVEAWGDGWRDVGVFLNGRLDGEGIRYRQDGAVNGSGRWENGRFIRG